MKDFERLRVISFEHYCKVNLACFKCLKMINSWKHSLEMYKSNKKGLVRHFPSVKYSNTWYF